MSGCLMDDGRGPCQAYDRLRWALDRIGAMVFMDRDGAVKFKPDHGPEDMLNAVNAALEE